MLLLIIQAHIFLVESQVQLRVHASNNKGGERKICKAIENK
jgi:hypothetical protein